MDLIGYEAFKFELAEILRALLARVPRESAAAQTLIPPLFTRLAEDRFNLLVAGRYSRGKSTLMNAIVGMDRLPTGLLPLTSVITSVGYGSVERARLRMEGFALGFDVALEDLADYITERGNPGNERRIRCAQIELPAEILRRGVRFVDSPGLGSSIAANTRTTREFLPQADAVLLVTGFEAPLAPEELEIVRFTRAAHRRLFVVLNKQDTVSDPERNTVLEYVRRELAGAAAGEDAAVLSVSARDGLRAKLTRQADVLAGSGIPALEHELTRFMIEDRGLAFMRGLCGRARELMTACQLPPGDPLWTRIETLACRDFDSRGARDREAQAYAPGAGVNAAPARVSECPLCREVRDGFFRFLAGLGYQLAAREQARGRFAAAGGLCAAHLHLYASIAADRDICVGLAPLLKHWVSILADETADALLRARQDCALCALQEELEHGAFSQWDAGRENSTDAGVLCLPHLQRLAQFRAGNGLAPARGQDVLAAAVERLAEDMQRYALKRDGMRPGLITQEEEQAARRAIALIGGSRVVFGGR